MKHRHKRENPLYIY